MEKYKPNAPETEEDGLKAGDLRLWKARRQFQALTGRTHKLLESQKSTQLTTESTLKDNPNTSN